MNWKAQAFIRGCAITNLSIRPETPREVTMSIFALPEELLTHIVAQVISRQDLVHLQLTCKKLLAATLDCREHEREKLSAALDGQMCFHTTANLEKLAISRVRSLSEAMIRSFLVAHLPSEQEVLGTLYKIAWTRVDLEAFVLETLYGYIRREHFLQDEGAVQRLREVYTTNRRLSALRQLLREEGEYCLTQESYSGVSQRALKVCKGYEDFGQWDYSLDLARCLLDGICVEFGRCAPSARCWAEHVQVTGCNRQTSSVRVDA
jgi:hypothetical protein